MNLREGSARIVKLSDSQMSKPALLLNAALPLTLVAAVAVLTRT